MRASRPARGSHQQNAVRIRGYESVVVFAWSGRAPRDVRESVQNALAAWVLTGRPWVFFTLRKQPRSGSLPDVNFSGQRRSLPFLAALAVLPAVVSATTLNISEAEGFNLVTWGNATLLNSDTEGRVAVGGNATFGGYSIGTHAVNPSALDASFVVGGNLAAGHGQVYNGSIYVGGTYSGPGYSLNSRPGSVTSAGLGAAVPFDFGAAKTALQAKSQSWGAEAATGTSVLQWSTLTLTGTNTDLNIFNITAAQLSSASTLTINVASGSHVLVNVSGASATFGNKGINGSFAAEDVLFNFHQATSLSMMNIGVEGSIVAPWADVVFYSGQMNGQLIANSFRGQSWGVGEMHQRPFDNQQSPVGVPDVAPTALLLVFGAAALWFDGRRRRA